jgi:hypothetical protein
VKLRKDKQFKQHKELKEKTEEVWIEDIWRNNIVIQAQEFKNKRENEFIWRNAEALRDRVEAEQEYYLLDKLINRH